MAIAAMDIHILLLNERLNCKGSTDEGSATVVGGVRRQEDVNVSTLEEPTPKPA